ncbi:MAG: hypothetical protein Q9223_001953 [Gallowayella weberi]
MTKLKDFMVDTIYRPPKSPAGLDPQAVLLKLQDMEKILGEQDRIIMESVKDVRTRSKASKSAGNANTAEALKSRTKYYNYRNQCPPTAPRPAASPPVQSAKPSSALSDQWSTEATAGSTTSEPPVVVKSQAPA